MPFHIAPLNRRRFLAGAAALGSSLLLPAHWAEAKDIDPDHWVLFSDPHIAENPAEISRKVNMAEHFRRAVTEVLALEKRPAGLLVNGDCAYNKGLAGDYATFSGLLKPLSAAGIPLHLTLGNHDDRANFRAGLKGEGGAKSLLESKQVSIIEGKRANWFVLDSLDLPMVTPGKLGDEQRAWLAKALDARKEKPAIVAVHHNLEFGTPEKASGLLDTKELFELLYPRKHVKALIYGHTHHWDVRAPGGLNLINLPPVGYVFKDGDPSGWVDMHLTDKGARLELRSMDPKHPAHGEVKELKWRDG